MSQGPRHYREKEQQWIHMAKKVYELLHQEACFKTYAV